MRLHSFAIIIMGMRNTGRIRTCVQAVLLCAVILLAGCGKKKFNLVPLTGEPRDMSGYLALYDEEPVYYDLDVDGMLTAMKQKKSFVVYFGYPECEWCMEVVPILNQAAKENEMQVGYINTRSNPEWTKNTQIDGYDDLIQVIGEYLEYDADGVRHLYVPTVFFIREGKVIGYHEGTLEGHNARNRGLDMDEQETLRNIYRDLFQQLKDPEYTAK